MGICQTRCQQMRSVRSLVCGTCGTVNGLSSLLVLQLVMVCTKELIGCPALFQQGKRTDHKLVLRCVEQWLCACSSALASGDHTRHFFFQLSTSGCIDCLICRCCPKKK